MKCGICEKNEANDDATISFRLVLPLKDTGSVTFGFEVCNECWRKIQVANASMEKEKKTSLGMVLGQAEIKNLKKVFKKITGV